MIPMKLTAVRGYELMWTISNHFRNLFSYKKIKLMVWTEYVNFILKPVKATNIRAWTADVYTNSGFVTELKTVRSATMSGTAVSIWEQLMILNDQIVAG